MSSGPRSTASWSLSSAASGRLRRRLGCSRGCGGSRSSLPSDSLAGRADAAASNAGRRRHLCGPRPAPASSAPSRCGGVVNRCEGGWSAVADALFAPVPFLQGAQRRSTGRGPAPCAPPLSRTMCSNGRPHAAAGRRVLTSSRRPDRRGLSPQVTGAIAGPAARHPMR